MKKMEQLYEGKAKKVFATEDPDVVIVDYKDDATAFNGEKKGTIVSRDRLMEYLWKTDFYVDENALSVNVNRLRKKLESIGIVDFIQTKKGLGYKI